MNDDQSDWHSITIKAAYEFAKTCREQSKANSGRVLDLAINTLMTELWDRCYSQTEIRTAFEKAIADMPRYTAGQETRP